ncbi:MAG: hypothetical protein ACR2OO_00550 [Thermomicrobiales bacterium]
MVPNASAAGSSDPRPDILHDTHHWLLLLRSAHSQDGGDPHGLFGVLHGLRCLGARLTVGDGQWRIERGEMAPAEYRAYRTDFLAPRAAAITSLLGTQASSPTLVPA